MINRIRAIDHCGLNKGRGSKLHVGSRIRQETPKEGRRTYRPKRWEYNNKDQNSCLKNMKDKYHKVSSKKFWQLTYLFLDFYLQ